MRKVTFYIDDLKWFREFYNLSDKQMEDLFPDKDSFKVIYTLYGEKDEIDHYTLTDYDGNKIDYNALNGFQRGVVLYDCWAYFAGRKHYWGGEKPCGVMRIEEVV